MRLNKLFMGLVLGVTLAAGTASTAEAKAKPVVVTVDKADASTARKVDAVFKKGKAVTLKVRGSKKASKALLIDLQKKTAKTMRYSIHFDLDDGNRDCEGKGNKFHTYKDLDYRQSGNYGCYTFSKSTCNAYKYAFKFIKRNVDRQMKAVKEEFNRYSTQANNKKSTIEMFKDYMQSEFEDAVDWYDIYDATAYDFFDAFLPVAVAESLGEMPEGSMDKFAEEAIANGTHKKFVEKIVKQAKYYLKKHTLSREVPVTMTIEEFIKERYGNDTLKFYKGGALEVAFSDRWSLAVRGIYLGVNTDKGSAMVYGEGSKNTSDGFFVFRKMVAGELTDGTDEFRFKSLVNKTARGVCVDYACVNRALIDYLGYASYAVGNDKADHEVCALNYKGVLTIFNNEFFEQCYSSLSKSFDKNAVPSDDEDVIYRYELIWSGYANDGWGRDFKDAMGSDYPF